MKQKLTLSNELIKSISVTKGSGKQTKTTASSYPKEDEVEKLASWILSREQAIRVEESIYFLPLNLSFSIPSLRHVSARANLCEIVNA